MKSQIICVNFNNFILTAASASDILVRRNCRNYLEGRFNMSEQQPAQPAQPTQPTQPEKPAYPLILRGDLTEPISTRSMDRKMAIRYPPFLYTCLLVGCGYRSHDHILFRHRIHRQISKKPFSVCGRNDEMVLAGGFLELPGSGY